MYKLTVCRSEKYDVIKHAMPKHELFTDSGIYHGF